jgi:hypothetical protein
MHLLGQSGIKEYSKNQMQNAKLNFCMKSNTKDFQKKVSLKNQSLHD